MQNWIKIVITVILVIKALTDEEELYLERGLLIAVVWMLF